VVRGRRSVALKIPKGIRNGQVLRLKGLGEAGADGGEPGDLQLTIELANDAIYTMDGNDVEAALPLSPWEASLGAKVHVRTPDAEVVLTVPPATSSGTRLRIRGHGLYRKGGGRGDFYVRARIVVPPSLTAEQKRLMEQLAATGGEAVRGGARGAAS
jgi:curved DNA-binding protein